MTILGHQWGSPFMLAPLRIHCKASDLMRIVNRVCRDDSFAVITQNWLLSMSTVISVDMVQIQEVRVILL